MPEWWKMHFDENIDRKGQGHSKYPKLIDLWSKRQEIQKSEEVNAIFLLLMIIRAMTLAGGYIIQSGLLTRSDEGQEKVGHDPKM